MVQRRDNQNPVSRGRQSDRTVIRPASTTPVLDVSKKSSRKNTRSELANREPAGNVAKYWKYTGIALLFLAAGAGLGGLALLVTRGAITISAPEQKESIAEDRMADGTQPVPVDHSGNPQEAVSDVGNGAEIVTRSDDPEDFDGPADPYYDMALSAVIPLAGDPVLLRSSTANARIQLSERPLDLKEGAGKFRLENTDSAYVLDSQMLDKSGSLVIRAPGSEVDFQFGNFGGGEETGALDIVEEDGVNDPANVPQFLKPSVDTLDLYLSERPIGQGANRIEIREEILKPVALKTFLIENGFDTDAVEALKTFTGTEFGKSDLVAGDRVAVRGIRLPNKIGRIGDYYRPVQLSLYGDGDYLGTAALSTGQAGGGYVRGADPWFGKPFEHPKVVQDKTDSTGKNHRLIDGLYATAVRNAVPASIVGEAIAYLAPMTDLKRAVKPGERFTLIFTGTPRDKKRGGGRVLFAGVRRADNWSVRCYVLKAPGNRGFACVNEGGRVSLSGAMLVPVKGVLTSKFGLRFHPIKKTNRLHAGVDWAAPTGTPIRAAFSGKVSYRAVRGGYGNFIELSHKDGIASRYAHMHGYGDGIELGSVVQAGDLIGYVGTTGLSTGPHLHFEIRQRGEPTDPLAFEMKTGTDSVATVSSPALKSYREFIETILVVQ